MADLPNPHDALFRALLCDPERARDFLRDHLPNNITGQLTDDLPEIMDGTFVDEALAGSQSDLLIKVRLASGGDAFVYVLCEAKSTPDPGVPLQLAGYMVRVWRRHAGDNARKLRNLPPIIPILVYHGSANWAVPEGLGDMIAADDPDLVFLPGEAYILRNLRAMEVEALSRNDALRLGFITLRGMALKFLTAIAQTLPEGSDLRRQVWTYIMHVYDVTIDDLGAELQRRGLTEEVTEVGTIADTLIKQGRAEGKAEGKAEGLRAGEELGLAKGKADTLRMQLVRRFGSLPDHARARIEDASPAQIDAWLDAVLDAPTLDAVLGSGPAG